MKRLIALSLLLLMGILPLLGFAAGKRERWPFQGSAAYYSEDGKIGLMHKSGNRTLMAPILTEARPFSNGMAAAKCEGLWGLIDPMGRWIFRYGSIFPIDFGPGGEHGLYSPKAGLWGFINRDGKVILEPVAYASAGVMSDGLFFVSDGKAFGYADYFGKLAIPYQYEKALTFSEKLAAVQKDGKWGYINQQGETVLPFEYAEAGSFRHGLAPVRMDESSSTVYIDPEGKVRLEGKWDWGGDFTADKLARVRIDGKYGHINTKGRQVVAARYEEATDFADGFAAVKSGENNWVFVSTKGKVVSKNYRYAEGYQDGCAFVIYEDPKSGEIQSGFVNKTRVFLCELMEPEVSDEDFIPLDTPEE